MIRIVATVGLCLIACSNKKHGAHESAQRSSQPSSASSSAGACGTDGKICHEQARKHRTDAHFDVAKAVASFEAACAAGHMLACSELSLYHRMAIGVKRDRKKSVTLLEKACDGGLGVGCFNLANYLLVDGRHYDPAQVKQRYAQAVTNYQKQCDSGDANWCSNLGFMYATGNGVEKDLDIAMSHYETGCKRGGDLACFSVSAEIIQAKDTSKDIAEEHWKKLEALCEKGLADACGMILTFHLREQRDTHDKETLTKIARTSCADGSAPNCLLLWVLDKKDEHLLRACELNDPKSCAAYGEAAYQSGRAEAAVVHLTQSCWGANEPACASAQRVSKVQDHRYLNESCAFGSPLACAAMVTAGSDLPLTPSSNQRMKDVVCSHSLQQPKLVPVCESWPAPVVNPQ